MPNILHAQDAEMFGRNKVQDWEAQFMARWNEPETVIAQAQWQSYPEEVRAVMRTMMDADILAIVEGNHGTKLVK